MDRSEQLKVDVHVLKFRFWRAKLLAAMFYLDFHNPTRQRGTSDGRCRERHHFFTCLRFGLELNPISQLQKVHAGIILPRLLFHCRRPPHLLHRRRHRLA